MPYRLDLLRTVRIAAGKSPNELAQASNQTVATIVAAEEGATVSGDAALQIANALGATLGDIGAAEL